MASVDPDGGQAFEELIGGHDGYWLLAVRFANAMLGGNGG